MGDDVGKVEDPEDTGRVVGDMVDLDIDVGGKYRNLVNFHCYINTNYFRSLLAIYEKQ